MITGFAPVWTPMCRILILGSMPSVKSLEQNQYYAHPRNAFWKIMCELLGDEYLYDYSSRCTLLTDNRIALWDVCRSCERHTSSDSMIRNEIANDIPTLAEHMRLNAVLLNGGTAAALYKRHIHLSLPTLRLPSTSPAYTLPYECKKDAWRDAFISVGIIK